MPHQLFDLPPELLIQILAALPTKPLLKFAQTSHYARNLSYSNLHTLSLAIFPSRRSSWHNKLFSAQHEPKPSTHPDHDPHKALIRIPKAWEFDYSMLLTFHSKIVASIVHRHACALQRLDLTLWTLTNPIAQALATLSTVRSLSIRIESVQLLPRARSTVQRKEERKAWDLLASTSSFQTQIRALAIENADISSSQLAVLLNGTKQLRTLKLSNCDMLTSSLWNSLHMERIQHLSVADCINVHVNETALDTISKMKKLQALDLRGCSGLDGEVLEQWNRDVWHVPEFAAPRTRGMLKEMGVIEVDPEYLLED